MRPRSVEWFSRLYLAGFILSSIGQYIVWDAVVASFAPDAQAIGVSAALMAVGTLAIGSAITVLLWYRIVMQAGRIARWLVLLIGLAGILLSGFDIYAGTVSPMQDWLYLISTALMSIAPLLLFTRDARYWFFPSKAVDPQVFA